MDVWSLILQVATLIAVLVAAWQLLFHSRQMHRDFEALYVERYWELMDRRSPGFVLDGEAVESDRLVARDYLQLCEDEIDCRRIGRVTDNTWEFWRASIVDQVSTSVYQSELASLNANHLPGLRALLANPTSYEPLGHGWLWRKTHGL